MDERIAIWNVLHDGKISAVSRASDVSTLSIVIPYLRRRLDPAGDSFVLKLKEVTHVSFLSFDGEPESLDEQLKIGRPEILSTDSEGMPVVINTTLGQLILAFGRLEILLDTGSPITFPEVEKAAEAYWNEWEQKAKEAR